ncbi:NAD-dependent epimerase/dehydratase - like 10 [Theobroma cacao]|nr:NAD-dependent epimerase/dehydratase - like 10 [Theobroma cacao]
MAKGKVCVTGGGGYLGSWILKLLLSNHYAVHATVRLPGDAKYAHLNQLEKASDNLKLFKADLLDYDSFCSAIEGCTGVFHVACPVPSTTVEMIEPAVKGTLNVLKACLEENVKRVVVVSSVSAVSWNPRWPKGQIKDEACWSDKEYCTATKNWYCFSKTEAESEAFELAKRTGLDVVTVCPTLILGPILQPAVNASSLVLIKLLKGGAYSYCTYASVLHHECKLLGFVHLDCMVPKKQEDIIALTVILPLLEGYDSLENQHWSIVDVRDVAQALLLVYEKPEAEGRYICTAHSIMARDLVDKLRSIFPNYNYPKSFIEIGEEDMLSSEKLQKLGWSYRPLEATLVDSVESYRKAGILD